MIEINGIAHIGLSVNNFEVSKEFYSQVLSFLGLKLAYSGKESLYYVGGRPAVGITPSAEKYKSDTYDQTRIGLHHFCFRSKSREDIDQLYEFLKSINAKIVHPPEEGDWAPGYYSLLFEDPDGIRLEINHVPGKGIFAEGEKFNPAGDYL